MAEEMQYTEFRQKLIDLVREVVTQLPELRREAEDLGRLLRTKTGYGEIATSLSRFSDCVSAQDLKDQLRNLADAADYATSPPDGCTREQFQSYKHSGDLAYAIKEALEEALE